MSTCSRWDCWTHSLINHSVVQKPARSFTLGIVTVPSLVWRIRLDTAALTEDYTGQIYSCICDCSSVRVGWGPDPQRVSAPLLSAWVWRWIWFLVEYVLLESSAVPLSYKSNVHWLSFTSLSFNFKMSFCPNWIQQWSSVGTKAELWAGNKCRYKKNSTTNFPPSLCWF